MKEDYYQTKRYMNDVMFQLEDDIEALEKWSAYNQDRELDEIIELKKKLEALKVKLDE